MVFIDKSTQHSKESKQRLENWEKTFLYNGKSLKDLYVEKGQKGGTIWDIFGEKKSPQALVKDRLREDLSIEQAHICCYCGQKLDKTRIEHFLSKAKDFLNRLFNYDNLLLSCDGEFFDKVQYTAMGKMETLKEFADRNKLTTKQIRTYNPNKNLKNLKVGDRIRCGEDHCDPHKGHIEDKEKKEIFIINPTIKIHKFCWQYFKFDYEGGIAVSDKLNSETIKTLALNSIRVLNLDVEELKKKRKKELKSFSDDWNNVAELYQYDLSTYFSDQLLSPKQPFCFVNYHFIQQLMEQ